MAEQSTHLCAEMPSIACMDIRMRREDSLLIDGLNLV